MWASPTPNRNLDDKVGLERLLGSCSAPLFLQEYLGERMLYVSGAPDRWSDLFSWQELNAVLNEGLLYYPSVRLIQAGENVDPGLYTSQRNNRQHPDSRRCQILMTEGATLVLENIQSINSRLDAFVRELERAFGADLRVDVVATCAYVPGLKLHWDNAECFNLQVSGEKHWTVIRPERPYPLTATEHFPQRHDISSPVAPTIAPTWEGIVAPGGLLYLPRGWWHVVTPHLSPSLHLSFALDIPTLSDFMRWFANQTARYEIARRPLPVWRAPGQRLATIAEPLALLASTLCAEAVDTYLTQLADSASVRPDFALPGAGEAGSPRLAPHTVVRLTSTRPIEWIEDGDAIRFEWSGHSYRFSSQVIPAIKKLESTHALTVDELVGSSNRLAIQAFLLTLLTVGLLAVTERGTPNSDNVPMIA